jgi:hypothetical protein
VRTERSAPSRALLALGVAVSAACGGNVSAVGADAAPPPAPSSTGAPADGAPMSPIPIDAVYAIHLQGLAGGLSAYAPFALPAELYLVRTIAPAASTTNGENPIEIAIFTSADVPAGANGALSFGTNLSLASIRAGSAAARALDVAFVSLSGAGSRLEAALDRDVLASPDALLGTFNVYGTSSGTTDHIVAGSVTARAGDSAQSITGTIQLAGSSGSQYSATFSGNRIR